MFHALPKRVRQPRILFQLPWFLWSSCFTWGLLCLVPNSYLRTQRLLEEPTCPVNVYDKDGEDERIQPSSGATPQKRSVCGSFLHLLLPAFAVLSRQDTDLADDPKSEQAPSDGTTRLQTNTPLLQFSLQESAAFKTAQSAVLSVSVFFDVVLCSGASTSVIKLVRQQGNEGGERLLSSLAKKLFIVYILHVPPLDLTGR